LYTNISDFTSRTNRASESNARRSSGHKKDEIEKFADNGTKQAVPCSIAAARGRVVAHACPLRYACAVIWSSTCMKPAFRLIAVLGITMLLAGCDRCGNMMELDMFLQPVKKVCTGQKPAG
jgi:hypothetical protein